MAELDDSAPLLGSINNNNNNSNNCRSSGKWSLKNYLAPATFTTLSLAYKSVGVIYGDIGTSPLYVFTTVFPQAPKYPKEEIYGAFSLIFWSLTLVLMLKYVTLVLLADDNGQGGTFALYSLLCRYANVSIRGTNSESDRTLTHYDTEDLRSTLNSYDAPFHLRLKRKFQNSSLFQTILVIIVLFGTSLVMGDGVLTPAVSVLSAVEGLQVVFPDMKPTVVPITISIILVLFLSQSYGTSKVAKYFAPFIFIWLFTLSGIGIYNISKNPEVIKAISPYYAYKYFQVRGIEGWESLGGILLSISGVEALFADLGHFSRRSIRFSATFIVYPSLILTYCGQAAVLSLNPSLLSNAFWETVPKSIYYFVLVIATFAATIASQAMISAAFSIIHQAMSLGCFPKVYVVHTSRKHIGQVYIPEISLILMVLSITLVAIFEESASLTAAYGLASCILMFLTTCLFSLVMAIVWKKSLFTIALFLVFFGSIDIAFLSSTLLKTFSGGWIPLALAIVFSGIMNLWKWGSELKYNYLKEAQVSLESLLIDPKFSTPLPVVPGPYPTDCELNEEKSLDWLILNEGIPSPIVRVPGIGLFYSEAETDVPAVFTHTLKCFNSVPRIAVFVTIRFVVVPTVLPEERFLISRLSINGFYRCVARYGYMDFIEEGKEFSCLMIDSLINYSRSMNEFLKDRQSAIHKGQSSNAKLASSITSNISENEKEIDFLLEASRDNITYIMGKNLCLPKIDSPWYRKFAIGYGYKFLSNNDRSFSLKTPVAKTVQVGMKMRL